MLVFLCDVGGCQLTALPESACLEGWGRVRGLNGEIMHLCPEHYQAFINIMQTGGFIHTPLTAQPDRAICRDCRIHCNSNLYG